MTSVPERYASLEYAEYNALPKYIGSVSSDVLLGYAALNAEQNLIQPSNTPNLEAVAGTALIEAVMVSKLEGKKTDILQNFIYLEEAERHLRAAAQGQYELLENGVLHPNDQGDWLRAEIACDFMDVYRDIAYGRISQQTVEEIRERLTSRLEYTETLVSMDPYLAPDNKGASYEIKGLLHVWNAYKEEGDAIAFPATARGGSGIHHPRTTHDMVCAAVSGNEWEFVGLEIKGGNGLTEESLERYDSPIMHITRKDEVYLINAHNYPLLKKIPTN